MALCRGSMAQLQQRPGNFEKYRFLRAQLKAPQVFPMTSQIWAATVKNMFNTCSLFE